MTRRKNIKRIDPRYFLEETTNRKERRELKEIDPDIEPDPDAPVVGRTSQSTPITSADQDASQFWSSDPDDPRTGFPAPAGMSPEEARQTWWVGRSEEDPEDEGEAEAALNARLAGLRGRDFQVQLPGQGPTERYSDAEGLQGAWLWPRQQPEPGPDPLANLRAFAAGEGDADEIAAHELRHTIDAEVPQETVTDEEWYGPGSKEARNQAWWDQYLLDVPEDTRYAPGDPMPAVLPWEEEEALAAKKEVSPAPFPSQKPEWLGGSIPVREALRRMVMEEIASMTEVGDRAWTMRQRGKASLADEAPLIKGKRPSERLGIPSGRFSRDGWTPNAAHLARMQRTGQDMTFGDLWSDNPNLSSQRRDRHQDYLDTTPEYSTDRRQGDVRQGEDDAPVLPSGNRTADEAESWALSAEDNPSADRRRESITRSNLRRMVMEELKNLK